MKKTSGLVSVVAFIFSVSLIFAAPVLAYPAESHAVLVSVVNHMDHSIRFHIDNNWGSMHTGDHSIEASGAKNAQGDYTDNLQFIFSSNNDEEFYTISYKGAYCKVDYPLIRNRFDIVVDITGSDANPDCELH